MNEQQTVVKNKSYIKFIFYLLPPIITIVVGKLSQLWIANSCLSLPVESRGECGAGWLQLIVMPATMIAIIGAWAILTAGIIHLSVKISRGQPSSTKILVRILGSFLALISLYGGILLSTDLIF